MLLSVVITVLFVVGEAALLSDGGYNFAKALALILSCYGLWIAARSSSVKRTTLCPGQSVCHRLRPATQIYTTTCLFPSLPKDCVRSPTVREGNTRHHCHQQNRSPPVFLNQAYQRMLPSLTVGLLTHTREEGGGTVNHFHRPVQVSMILALS